MQPTRVDQVSRFFAGRRFSRRRTPSQGGAELAAAVLASAGPAAVSAQGATPDAVTPDAEHGPTMLFVQSFQSGGIVPKEGEDGRFTVTLEHGLGQTIYFSDRPDRVVGASPTPQFLAGLGFSDDNPPNAALVVEKSTGETDIAVVELFNPRYDPTTRGVTYEVAVLADWEDTTELGFTAATTDLAALAASFGSAHLFIDDCGTWDITCTGKWGEPYGIIPSTDHDGWCYGWYAWQCLPCAPWYKRVEDAMWYWAEQCDQRFDNCQYEERGCWASGIDNEWILNDGGGE